MRDSEYSGVLLYGDCPYLSPLMALRLAFTLERSSDQSRDAIGRSDWEVFHWLPPLAVVMHGADPTWLGRFADQAADLRTRLLAGDARGGEFVRNMAQQVWIERAFSVVHDLAADDLVSLSVDLGLDGGTPPSAADWETAKDCMLPDYDHEYLWDARLDGLALESLPPEMGIGDELDPDNWFVSFWGDS